MPIASEAALSLTMEHETIETLKTPHMDTIAIRPERKAELERLAVDHGQSTADMLDDA